ncbi:alkyl hydroperoxide reductase subunit F [Methylophaga sp. OBS1]|uniref:alkyl hydroperoxide reductase subunit F n=1 Tax=Methylophaga sp. OBS1 TaxID=2991933 RepID=UPI00225A6300|nr:alkyl hydroperoxide reductase subunit F [Methylophaga sp. OBS1]MCX4190914.1 alkyl hydroperoxide reductase subunit F [Methylophaga sp. OBS1]MCX4192140.1 alkyl hydroperoxide reductase subunit F [Methylophaga sp. OBS1]
MLDANIAAQLKGYLENIKRPIELVAALDESAKANEMRELLQEIAEMSPQISFVDDVHSDSRKPSFQIKQPDGEEKIRFAGIPMGHEFTSLVLALLHTGGHPTKLSEEVIDQIKNLEGEYHFETYISLSCQNCPEVVQALNVMAIHNPNISHTMIDGALFQDEVDERQIMAVPTVYLNDKSFGQGRMSLPEIIAKLDKGAVKREAEKISAKDDFDVLIVGGGPAGASASIYAARKGIRTGIVAERFGGQVMDTMAIENFISVKETEGPKLVAALEEHVKEYDVDVMNLQRAKKLSKKDKMIEVELESGATLCSKTVILATGARWKQLGVPGEEEYRGHGVAYCPHCDGPLFKGKPVAVIGGGNSGVEAAIDLAGIVGHVTLIEYNGELRADAVLQKKLFSLDNVSIVTGAQTTEITGADGKVNGLVYIDRATEQKHTLDLNAVFIQIGLVPNTDWLEDTITLSKYGEIEIDNHGQTSMPGVFAAGDVTTIPYKQIIMAMGDGARAALGSFDYIIRSDFDDDKETNAA